MAWVQLHITTTAARAPLVESLLEALGAVSVTFSDAADEPMFEPPLGTTPLWRSTRVSGLFPADRDLDELRAALAQGADELGSDAAETARIEVLEDQQWERLWLERLRPMRFGKRLWVCPGGFRVEDPAAVVIALDPGLAFGTGTHPTTALCLRWLDQADLAGVRVIDFGCGSGILGIAAAKLGAYEVIALDHDPQALFATENNTRANGVAGRLRIHRGPAVGLKPARIVVANILANVLIDLADTLTALVAPTGHLVLSGMLAEQTDQVAAAFAGHFELEAPAVEAGWARLVGHRAP
jgi:ribosomal protein L11 methyltransferase